MWLCGTGKNRAPVPPTTDCASALLCVAYNALDEPVDGAHGVIGQLLAFLDLDAAVLRLDGALEDDQLAAIDRRLGLSNQILDLLRDLRAKRRDRHAAVLDAAAQEDGLPGLVEHGGGQ